MRWNLASRVTPSPRRNGLTRLLRPVLGTVLASTLLAGPGAAAAPDPALSVSQATLDAAVHCPAAFAHPQRDPVLLVHGTGMSSEEAWSFGYAEALESMGYDVCRVDLPRYALVDVQESSEYVVNAIRRIQERSGRQVDVVGHSQGNIEIRWAVRWWPDARTGVDDVVFLASPAHGGVSARSTCPPNSCLAPGWQLYPGSQLLTALNNGDETPGAISYTSLYSRTDEIVYPSTTSVTSGATNIALQDVCPGRVVSHAGLLYDALSFALTVDAVSNAGTADVRRLPTSICRALIAPKVSAADLARFNSLVAVTVAGRLLTAPKVGEEPPLRAYARP